MNAIMENIKRRRSKRYFIDRSISEDKIKEILEAGRHAPSALNKQPWKFIIITNKHTIKVLSSLVKEAYSKITKFLPVLKIVKPMLRDPQVVAAVKKTLLSDEDTVFYNAPLLAIIVANKGEHYAAKDCAIAAQNMMLYAHSIGIQSCYIGRAEILMMSKQAKEMIMLPPNHAIQSAIVFGYTPAGENGISIPQRKTDNIINWMR